METKNWYISPPETWPEAEDQILENSAIVMSCGGCSGGEDVGYIGGPSNGLLAFSEIHSEVDTISTIRIKYTNGDCNSRFSQVTCNGVTHDIEFLSTGSS